MPHPQTVEYLLRFYVNVIQTWLNIEFIVHVSTGCEVYNLGTGKGTSVLEMVAAFEKASGKVSLYL